MKQTSYSSEKSITENKPIHILLFIEKSCYCNNMCLWQRVSFYRAFHRFGQTKFAYGGMILSLSQFTLHTAPADSKDDARFKSPEIYYYVEATVVLLWNIIVLCYFEYFYLLTAAKGPARPSTPRVMSRLD